MSGEAWLYLFAVIINAVNLFLQVFFTIMYSDLEWYGIPHERKKKKNTLAVWGGKAGELRTGRSRFDLLRHARCCLL